MKPIFLHRFEKGTPEGPIDTLVAFVGAAAFKPSQLASLVSEETDEALAPDQLVIVARRDMAEEITDAMAKSRELKSMLTRLHRTSVSMLVYDVRGRAVDRLTLANGARTSEIDLDEILRRGSTAIFRERGGFVEPNASYHFANPSGRHTDRFMRLSNILVRNAEIAFVAVAVMRLVPKDASRAYIDTPSLYAVIASINDQWRSLDPDRDPLVADNFRSYEGLDAYPFQDFERSVVLISASSSGGLARAIEARGFARESVIHVLYLGSVKQEYQAAIDLCRDTKLNPLGYEDTREIYESGSCRMCDRGSKYVPLRGDQFDIQGPQPAPLVMRQAHAPKGLDKSMARLSGTGALAVTTGDRQYWADPVAMMEATRFVARLDYLARRHVPGSARHCIIPDETSRPFAERILGTGGANATIILRSDIDSVLGASPDNPSPVIVCAATVGGGRVLLEISRDLRQVCRKAPIVYFAGIAKPSSTARRDTLARNLEHSHHHAPHAVYVVDEFILPGPSFGNAWQDEMKFLGDTRDGWPEDIREVLDVRLDRLRRASEPMHDDLFLANEADRDLRLQEGFAFWSEVYANTQADVFTTMSAVMQKLRDAPDRAGGEVLRTNWLQQTLLGPENFGRFNDGVIQACILRGARPAELDYRDDHEISSDAARIVRRILEASAHARGEAAAEFLIAIGSGRLRVRDEHAQEMLQDVASAPPLVVGLAKMVRDRLNKLSTTAGAPG